MSTFENLNKFLSKYTDRYVSTRIVFILDMLMSLAASMTSILLLSFIVRRGLFSLKPILLWMVCSAVFSFLCIYVSRSYRIIIRHTTIKELWLFLMIAFTKVTLSGLTFTLVFSFSNVLVVLAIADFFITFLFMFLLRIAMLAAYNIIKGRISQSRTNQTRVLIYGVDVRSVSLLGRLHDSKQYSVAGFVQFGSSSVHHVISEKRVFYVSSEVELVALVKSQKIDAILFSSDSDIRLETERIVKFALEHGVKMLSAPAIDEVRNGKFLHSIRNIEIEDLLMRSEIKISMKEIVECFENKTVMVTGAAGSIGEELCYQLASLGVKELILYDNAETPIHNLRLELEERYPELKFDAIIGDVRIKARLDYVFRTRKPQIVFHAAAYKHVPLMEENPCEAVLVNVVGTRNVADKCVEYAAEKMVMVSTDKAVNPTNIMGCTKRIAEVYVQSLGLAIERGEQKGQTKFVTTRFGNVLGSNGSVIPRFREQISKGGPVTVTHPEITRFFMTIPEACRLVLEAAMMSVGNQIFVFDMGEPVKIDFLARRMIELAGYVPDKDIMVEYMGLRPGEKLYEEVLSNHENTIPTDHSSIRIAKVREYGYDCALRAVEELETLSRSVMIPEMVRLMKKMIPEYISNNSRFEEYDCHSER